MGRVVRWFYYLVFGWPVIIPFLDNVGCIKRVEGISMQPTLNPEPWRRDFVVLKRWDKYNVSRGEIVSVSSPKDPPAKIVKRIIALEGDRISMGYGLKDYVIPKGHIWIEGDNSRASEDSRRFGPVPLALVEGKVVSIIWPLDRIQRLEKKVKMT